MDKQIDIPEQIRHWNWGAFLLTPFWCIRHGIWLGLLLFIPIFGLIIPFILGAKGNQKAWIKNTHESVENFLKRQRFWGFAGLAVWIVGLFLFIGSLSYSLNYSDGMKMGLEITNSNKRLITYFGKPIKKTSFLNGNYNYIITPEPSTLLIAFDAIGSQNSGQIHLKWEKRDEDWVATEMTYIDTEGRINPLVKSPILESSFFKKTPYAKTTLENALNQMIQEKEGYVILLRSKENNDFIQAATEILNDGDVVFSVLYSDGFTKLNKQLYHSKDLFLKDEIIKIFTSYAAGDDSHLSSIDWNKLTSIKLEGTTSGSFIFGEAL